MSAIKSTKVPKAFGETYAAITSITDDFCREHLNEEYSELASFVSAALCRKRPSCPFYKLCPPQKSSDS